MDGFLLKDDPTLREGDTYHLSTAQVPAAACPVAECKTDVVSTGKVRNVLSDVVSSDLPWMLSQGQSVRDC